MVESRSETELEDKQALDNLALDLSAFGMSLNQSKVYLHLLANGSVSARNISEDLGLHRVDVYRKLRDLQNLGIVEMYLGSPKTYVAMEPKLALTKLLTRMESKIGNLRTASRNLEDELREFRLRHNSSNKEAPFADIHGTFYRIGNGTERYFAEIARMIRGARKEVLTVVSARGVKQIFKTNLLKHYKNATNRGVTLKFITEVGSNNANYLRRLNKLSQSRVLEAVHLRFVVADRSVALLRWQTEPLTNLSNVDDNFFVINDSKFALSTYLFFEDLWQYGHAPNMAGSIRGQKD